MAKLPPHERLQKWVESTGLKAFEAAALVGIDSGHLSHLCSGGRWPGRTVANRIEAVTAKMSGGPIRSEDWDDAEAKLARARTGTEG